VQVEAALVLSVAVRWGPVMTAVNGTLVARPAGEGGLSPSDDITLGPLTAAIPG
jgi:hypothetical protein